MRGLTRRAAAPEPALAVPAYFHPAVAPNDWEGLRRLAGRLRFVVVNVADGPGEEFDEVYAAALRRLTRAGVDVVGYVTSAYAGRTTHSVLAAAARYREWYGVRGVFVDQVASGPATVPHYRQLVERLREAGAGLVVLNPGVWPDAGLHGVADVLVTFEGPWEAYLAAQVPGRDFVVRPDTICHLVYAVPVNQVTRAMGLAQRRRAGVLYVTSGVGENPWATLSAYVHAP